MAFYEKNQMDKYCYHQTGKYRTHCFHGDRRQLSEDTLLRGEMYKGLGPTILPQPHGRDPSNARDHCWSRSVAPSGYRGIKGFHPLVRVNDQWCVSLVPTGTPGSCC